MSSTPLKKLISVTLSQCLHPQFAFIYQLKPLNFQVRRSSRHNSGSLCASVFASHSDTDYLRSINVLVTNVGANILLLKIQEMISIFTIYPFRDRVPTSQKTQRNTKQLSLLREIICCEIYKKPTNCWQSYSKHDICICKRALSLHRGHPNKTHNACFPDLQSTY